MGSTRGKGSKRCARCAAPCLSICIFLALALSCTRCLLDREALYRCLYHTTVQSCTRCLPDRETLYRCLYHTPYYLAKRSIRK